jgi:TetR/AcrR family transcriptional regulator, regulator of autoinduction and epiphytic fitness
VTERRTPARVDGRSARAARTRRAIVDAHLTLLSEGELRTSPDRIAERAGVSVRTLWTNFKDLQSLHAAVNDRLLERLDAEYQPIATAKPLAERVSDFSEQRGRLLEILAPAVRAVAIRLPSEALKQARLVHHGRSRMEIEYVFATELSAAGPEREELARALVAHTSSAAWAILRDELQLDLEAATAVIARTVSALLRHRELAHR